MKKTFKLLFLLILCGELNAQVSNFTITNHSGSYSLTCSQTSVVLSASTTVIGPNSFSWTSASFTATAPSVTLTQAGVYIVTALDSLNNVFGTQQFTISSNTTAQSSAVSPATQAISCTATVGAVVTSNASGNVTHTFVSPYGGSVLISNQAVASYTSLGTGTYTHILLDHSNGCQSTSTFTLSSPQGFPTFSLVSPNNYTLGCGTKSVASIHITNATTSPTVGGPVSYTFVQASQLNSFPPIVGPPSSFTANVPGLYYAIVKDNSSGCITQIPVSILSNTSSPDISASVPTQILDCNTSQVILQGNSITTNVSLQWSFVGTPSVAASGTIQVNTNSIVPTTTLLNTYTLTVTDLNNTCMSYSVIPMYQNLFKPNALISANNTEITCATPTVVLTNQSTTGIPLTSPFPNNQPVIGYLWTGPASQPTLSVSSTYTVFIAGAYTMIAKDLNNGCTSSAVIQITGDCNLVGVQKNKSSELQIKTFPNPSNGLLTAYTENLLNATSIEIYNSIGVMVKKQTLTSTETLLNIKDQANGIYIIRVVQDNTVLHVSKIVKE